MPLLGADGYRALWNQRRPLAVTAGVHPVRVTAEAARLGAPDIAAHR